MDSPLKLTKRRLIQPRPSTPETPSRGLNLSITLEPFELQRLLGANETKTTTTTTRFSNNTLNATALEDSISSRSIVTAEQQQQNLMFKEKMDMIFPQFLEVLQGRSNESEVFDTIQELIHACVGVSDNLQREIERSGTTDLYKISQARLLEEEAKTWKLLFALYKDRTQNSQIVDDSNALMECDLLLGASEKEVVDHLYTTNATLREHQLIVDWLEATYENRDSGPEVGHSSDHMVGWENTLFQLQKRQNIAFDHGAEIVKSLDPDAPIREKHPLHPLDEEDNMRLLRCVFKEIRQGRIDEAMSLCKYCGQTWRAVILEGWRLNEDPNYEIQINANEKLPIEGNPRRDIWKKCAWMMADSKKYDETWRAIVGAFSGHLESLKTLLGNSWEDLLWAYLKVQIDIRVESEIRTCCIRNYHNMPEAYWNSKMTMQQIFDELAVHNDASVREYAESKIGQIQKHLIMDNVTDLLLDMNRWVRGDDERPSVVEHNNTMIMMMMSPEPSLSPHLLRFFAHIVLFMRQIGRIEKDEMADEIIGVYVESLIQMDDAQLVAFYTAALPNKMQIILYSKFLEGITATTARSAALSEAMNAGLDIESITRHTVETMRNRMPTDDEQPQPHAGDITAFDERKIRALEWLNFLKNQRGDLLWEANSMIRCFLAEGKAECVRAVYEMVPGDTIAYLNSTYGSESNLPCREECSIKEYISYKVYLVAQDSFEDWSKLLHNQPKMPEPIGADANFTERIASDHRKQQYRAELNRWNESLKERAKLARDALYNVLVFPEQGWLIDPVTSKEPVNIEPLVWENRRIQMEKLRSICIPEIVILLHKILHQSEDYQGCVKLSETLADETQKLYKVYNEHKLAEILLKIAESSLQLLNAKKDPWGYQTTI